MIRVWVNYQTSSDGFSPLHFASFSGNLDAIEELLANNADIKALTKTKMTMMHVAAQSDQVISLYFFKTKGLDLNAVDE